MDSATLLKIHSAVRWGKPIAELKEAGLTGPDFQQKISADMFAEDRACGFEMNCERLKMLKDLSQNIILCLMAPKIWIAFNLHSMMLVYHLYTSYIFYFCYALSEELFELASFRCNVFEGFSNPSYVWRVGVRWCTV